MVASRFGGGDGPAVLFFAEPLLLGSACGCGAWPMIARVVLAGHRSFHQVAGHLGGDHYTFRLHVGPLA